MRLESDTLNRFNKTNSLTSEQTFDVGFLSQNKNLPGKCQVPTPLTTLLCCTAAVNWLSVSPDVFHIDNSDTQTNWPDSGQNSPGEILHCISFSCLASFWAD